MRGLAFILACATLLSAIPLGAAAQEPAGRPGREPTTERASEEGPEIPLFEAEFAGSTVFQSGTVAAKLWSPIRVEIHYFGMEDNDIATVGLAWEFEWRGLRVLPGVGWSFGHRSRPAPVLSARWVFESEDWTSQGLWVQALGDYQPPHAGHEPQAAQEDAEAIVRYPSALDGIHVSRRIGRVEIGPLVEHIRYREEDAWKGGGRVAVRVHPTLRLVAQVVGPGTEVRGGFVWER